jgi:multidrug transporter EmrE-like cation transporter
MAWLAVITAGILEVGFATMLKLSNNGNRLHCRWSDSVELL